MLPFKLVNKTLNYIIYGLFIDARILTSFNEFSFSFIFKLAILTFFKAYSLLSDNLLTLIYLNNTFIYNTKGSFS